MEGVQRETYSRGRERLAGCQMLRCGKARCHTSSARSLVQPLLKCFSLSDPPLLQDFIRLDCPVPVVHPPVLILLMANADNTPLHDTT